MPTLVIYNGQADNPFEGKNDSFPNSAEWKLYKDRDSGLFLLNTSGMDRESSNGGGIENVGPDQRIMIDIGIPGINEYNRKEPELLRNCGCVNVRPDILVGAICMDTERDLFGLWQDNAKERYRL